MNCEEPFKTSLDCCLDCLTLIAEIKTKTFKRCRTDSENRYCEDLKDSLVTATSAGLLSNNDFCLELQQHEKYLIKLVARLKAEVALTAKTLAQREQELAAVIVVIYDKRQCVLAEITSRQQRLFGFQKLLLSSKSRLSKEDFRSLIERTNEFVIHDTCLLQESEFCKELAHLKKDFRRAITLAKLRSSSESFEVNGNIIIHPRLFAALCNEPNHGRHVTFTH